MEIGGCSPLRDWLGDFSSSKDLTSVWYPTSLPEGVISIVDIESYGYLYRDPNEPFPFYEVPVDPKKDSMNDEFKEDYILRNWLKQ
jgi:hypothetical protein